MGDWRTVSLHLTRRGAVGHRREIEHLQRDAQARVAARRLPALAELTEMGVLESGFLRIVRRLRIWRVESD